MATRVSLPPWLPLSGVVLVALWTSGVFVFLMYATVPHIIHGEGVVVADRASSIVQSREAGVVVRVYVAVGDHLEKNAPLIAVDPHASDAYFEERNRLLPDDEKRRLTKAIAAVNRILSDLDAVKSVALSELGVSGETFNLLNDLYMARLDLDNAVEYRRTSLTHQKTQISSEIALVERNIDLLKRNLQVSKKEEAARDAALASKRDDFAALMKLADKGLVSTTDVNRERDLLLQAELAVTENNKQVDEVELEISNRTLHISQLRMKSATVSEDANSRLSSAKLQYDLRMARLHEHKESLTHDLQQLEVNMSTGRRSVKRDEHGLTIIQAPIAGMLTRLRFFAPGDTLSAGAHVASLQPDGARPIVLVKILNKDVGHVREGQAAKVHFAAFPSRQFGMFDATVTRLFADPESSDFTAKLVLHRTHVNVDGTEAAILPGLAATAEIFTTRETLLHLLLRRRSS